MSGKATKSNHRNGPMEKKNNVSMLILCLNITVIKLRFKEPLCHFKH